MGDKQSVLPQNDEFTPMTIWTKGEMAVACFTTYFVYLL